MATINEEFKLKSSHTIRVNDQLIKICEETGLSLSQIVENSLVNYCTFDDEQKIKFLVDNDPDKVEASELKRPKFNYAERAKDVALQEVGNKPLGRSSEKILIAIGLALLAALFFKFIGKDSSFTEGGENNGIRRS